MSKSSRARLWNSFKRALNIAMGCRVYRNALVPPYPVADDLQAYCLRHTYCCDLVRLGIDPRITQKLMGHSRPDVTLTVYTHINDDLIKSTAETMWKSYENVETDVETNLLTIGNAI